MRSSIPRQCGALVLVSSAACSTQLVSSLELPDAASARPPAADAQISAQTSDAGWPTSDASQAAGAVAAPLGDALPSEVCGVLQKNACLTCHGEPRATGAPRSLTLASQFAGVASTGRPFGEALLGRVTDPAAPMPPGSTGRPLPSADDVAVLRRWVEADMKGVAGPVCTAPARDPRDPGSDAVPSWATQPWPEGECEVVLTLGAHGQVGVPVAEDQSAFPIPGETTSYHCFYEKVPWGDKKMQALALRVRFDGDDQRYLHHVVVSGVEPFSQTVAGQRPSGPGDHKPCMNPNGGTLAVWAPGALNPLTYPSDVGVLLPSGDSYMEFQIHYNNPDHDLGKLSKARYEICATSKLRPQTAGVFWLGYENAFAETLFTGKESSQPLDNLGNGQAQGRCEAKTRGRILSVMPHMHQRGAHAQLEIVRKDGSVQPIFSNPFDFRDEVSYFRESLWLDPGDVARTRCTWDESPVHFGFGTDAEMCFFYTLAYPLELFKASPLEKGVVGGDLACAHALLP